MSNEEINKKLKKSRELNIKASELDNFICELTDYKLVPYIDKEALKLIIKNKDKVINYLKSI